MAERHASPVQIKGLCILRDCRLPPKPGPRWGGLPRQRAALARPPSGLTDYDSLSIHYQFHTSQRDPAKDPLVTWHQGGPGGSSINVGLYTEMGYFQLDDKGAHANPYAWNKVANMRTRPGL